MNRGTSMSDYTPWLGTYNNLHATKHASIDQRMVVGDQGQASPCELGPQILSGVTIGPQAAVMNKTFQLIASHPCQPQDNTTKR